MAIGKILDLLCRGRDPGSKQNETRKNECLKRVINVLEILRSDGNFPRPMIFEFTLATPIGSSFFFLVGDHQFLVFSCRLL